MRHIAYGLGAAPERPVTPKHRLVMAVVLGALLSQLAGCSSGPESGQAVKWVTENEAERARLTADGFPQYIGGGGG